MYVSIVCTALLGIPLFGLGLFVSIQRQRCGTLIGYDQNPVDAIHRAVRAHANTAEYAPFPAIMFLWHGTHHAPAWILWTIAIATLSRCLLAGSLLFGPTMAKPNSAGFFGALATYVCGILPAAVMLERALAIV